MCIGGSSDQPLGGVCALCAPARQFRIPISFPLSFVVASPVPFTRPPPFHPTLTISPMRAVAVSRGCRRGGVPGAVPRSGAGGVCPRGVPGGVSDGVPDAVPDRVPTLIC